MAAMNVPGLTVRPREMAPVARRAPMRARLLAGIFTPGLPDLRDTMRRATLITILASSSVGALAFLAFSREPSLVAPVAVALAFALAAAAIPWQRFPEDAFAIVGIVAAALVTWIVAATGGIDSPYTSLWFVAASFTAVPLPQRSATGLTLAIAALQLAPFAYEQLSLADGLQLVVRSTVLVFIAVLIPILMARVRAAESRAGREQEASAELRRAQEARKEYMSVLAHELRNPLVAIGAAARVLAKQTADTPAEVHAAGIVTEVRHSLELLDALTDVSSIESGRLRSALRPIDIGGIVRDGVGAAGVTDHDIAILGDERPIVVLGDARRLGQVIRNLVGNAAKYAPAETKIEVSIGVSSDRSSAIVAVRDEGPGVPPAERSRLFEKFARLSTAGATRGSGLGLYISREIVKDHNGELWADWPAGGGSVFSFSLPLADARFA